MVRTSIASTTLCILVVASSLGGCAAQWDEEASVDDDEAAAKKKKKEKEDPAATDTAIVVYDLNLENVPSPDWPDCKGSGLDFPKYIGAAGDAPDVFTVQQLSGRAQANAYAGALAAATGKPYAAILAEEDPSPFQSGCPLLKDLQTTGILFRTDRFELVAGSVVTFQPKRSDTDACSAGERSSLSRTRAVGARLRDRKGPDTVGVVSMHFPKDDMGCAEVNLNDALDRLEKIGGNLRILAGDANRSDRDHGTWARWYERALARGYLDPIKAACGGDAGCVRGHWSVSNASGNESRIDFVFAERASGKVPDAKGATTISHAAVRKVAGAHPSLPYSDHRAIRVRLVF